MRRYMVNVELGLLVEVDDEGLDDRQAQDLAEHQAREQVDDSDYAYFSCEATPAEDVETVK